MGRVAVLVWMVVMAVVACGDENTAPDSASVPGADAPPDPRTTVLVSPTGDDANDGLGSPVRTLGRGIAIARSNTAIRTIALATGRYDVATGELFPYTVPANVTIAGPAGGGALLVGQGLQRGLVMSDGKLADLELQSFTVAATVVGTAELSNLRVRSSKTAILAEQGTGTLTLTAVDIDGMFQPCPVGVEIHVGHRRRLQDHVRGFGRDLERQRHRRAPQPMRANGSSEAAGSTRQPRVLRLACSSAHRRGRTSGASSVYRGACRGTSSLA